MAEWISRDEAEAAVTARTGNAQSWRSGSLLAMAIGNRQVLTMGTDPVGLGIINKESLYAWIDGLMGVGPKVVPKVATAAKVSNRPPDQREAAKAVLRALPASILQGKRAALLAEVNQRLETAISMDTLRRALDEI
ncbi:MULTISPECIES: hypothetical protein [unclassified Mesorhizobium]|uniref:hypothetical protein n=1 Tax=unclassified Mesorhizobium TaxID=325217 RepID=UPI000FC9B9CD|nr:MULTISPECIES: hypothetical protein [unclassified Mesorhizobium]TGU07863.1 hypothetical protein EN806_31455 [bacterium M00.F.Ca.ET.163.01.1.1]TGU47069.1 hypothetical protein EN789_13630 [bacterium M00.F.Ca.ET.146.01.1.1]TGW12703.1 hypothetical protein EN788_08075 [Mesorhizobium sp. M2D.F.Ca.ET.145.01.1.1]TGP33321.1 hypothetical protein EN875_015375 [Mesorhizobium sp. M2D.F.Ca.ET.232.01.1.1]TGP59381.1 hypothetical protein EN869_013965 [Mesorhizobium sp. M2D.F.Ca.ET.226.01.1.1]